MEPVAASYTNIFWDIHIGAAAIFPGKRVPIGNGMHIRFVNAKNRMFELRYGSKLMMRIDKKGRIRYFYHPGYISRLEGVTHDRETYVKLFGSNFVESFESVVNDTFEESVDIHFEVYGKEMTLRDVRAGTQQGTYCFEGYPMQYRPSTTLIKGTGIGARTFELLMRVKGYGAPAPTVRNICARIGMRTPRILERALGKYIEDSPLSIHQSLYFLLQKEKAFDMKGKEKFREKIRGVTFIKAALLMDYYRWVQPLCSTWAASRNMQQVKPENYDETLQRLKLEGIQRGLVREER